MLLPLVAHLSDDPYLFFCILFLLLWHINTPSMMTVFYFTVSYRGSISKLL